MLQINYVRQTGVSGLTAIMYFEFLFDNATELPAGSYSLEETNYLIAENSIAVDTDGSNWYKFNGKKWIKQLSPIPTLTDSTNITKGGKHLISNNTVRGLRDFDVDADIPSVLAEKNITTNGTYNASSDNVEGYSKVTVDVDTSFNKIITYFPSGDSSAKKIGILDSDSGEYIFDFTYTAPAPYGLTEYCLLTPAKSMNVQHNGHGTVAFTPSAWFTNTSITMADNICSLIGDDVVPNDGKLYVAYIYRQIESDVYVYYAKIKKYDVTFTYTIE